MNIVIIIIIIIIANINIIITTFVRTITFKLSVMQHTEGPADGRGCKLPVYYTNADASNRFNRMHQRRRFKQ